MPKIVTETQLKDYEEWGPAYPIESFVEDLVYTVRQLQSLLKQVEFVGSDIGRCQFCMAREYEQHESNCQLHYVIKDVK